MKLTRSLTLIPALLLALNCFAQNAPDGSLSVKSDAQAPDEKLSLWYRQPARVWTEALAIGNGRLGAMVFGGVEHER
ncbi:MAG TPA: glycoside hydrolase N-terminal domain-containing protein, partial [Verrucomicrobiae bacterium]